MLLPQVGSVILENRIAFRWFCGKEATMQKILRKSFPSTTFVLRRILALGYLGGDQDG